MEHVVWLIVVNMALSADGTALLMRDLFHGVVVPTEIIRMVRAAMKSPPPMRIVGVWPCGARSPERQELDHEQPSQLCHTRHKKSDKNVLH